MNIFAGIIYVSAMCVLFYKAFHIKVPVATEQHNESEPELTPSYNKVEEHINNLNNLKSKLDTIEQMITDIEICSPDTEIKSIKLSVPNKQGNYNYYDFLINGDDNTSSSLLDILYDERQALRSSLNEELKNPCYRANANGNANDYVFE